MTEKRLMWWGAALVAAAIIAAIVIIWWNPTPVSVPGGRPPAQAPGTPAASEPSAFNPDVPRDATLSDAVNEAPAAPGTEELFKTFNITAAARGYDPSTLTIRMGDITQIRFSATDGDYDLFVPYAGLYQSVRRGETRQITFQATTAGTFQFFCRDHCPSGGRIEGAIVVLPRR